MTADIFPAFNAGYPPENIVSVSGAGDWYVLKQETTDLVFNNIILLHTLFKSKQTVS